MADRTDLPRIPVTTRPSLFNREAGGWSLLVGIIGAGIAFAVAPTLLPLLGIVANPANLAIAQLVGSAVGTFMGFAYGGEKGKARQEQELRSGRVVKDPTYLNSGIFSALGAVKGLDIILTGGLLAGGYMTGTQLAAATAGSVAAGTALTVGAVATALAPVLIVAAIGSIIRKHSMQRDYNYAVSTLAQMQGAGVERNMSETMGRGPAIYKDSVSAQETALLNARQAGDASRSFAGGVSADRAQASETSRS